MSGESTVATVASRPRRRRGAGDRPVSLRDVAQHCGLSVYPVSRVLSGQPGVAEETAERIREAAAELGYQSEINAAARRLASRKSGRRELNHVIGVFMPGHLGAVRFFSELFRGVSEAVSAHGFGLLVLPTYDLEAHRGVSVELPPAVLRGEVDGLIVHHALEEEWGDRLRSAAGFGSYPIVYLDATRDVPGVVFDHREGGRLALGHLLEQGHRRVLYMRRSQGYHPRKARLQGFRDACKTAGVSPEECLLPVSIERDDLVEEALRKALAEHPEATALMAINDPNALAACYAFERLGVSIPDRMSVVGWDDTEPWPDATGENRLTSVDFDQAGMGREAVGLLMEPIETPGAEPRTVDMPARLAVRQSTRRVAG